MEIAIISDTHLPRGARRLPEACVARLRAWELIIHAGDLMRASVLAELRSYAQVVAVHGNVDDAEVRSALPRTAVVEAGAVRIGVIHDGGPARERLARLRAAFPEAGAVVFGHSHVPLHERAPDAFRSSIPAARPSGGGHRPTRWGSRTWAMAS